MRACTEAAASVWDSARLAIAAEPGCAATRQVPARGFFNTTTVALEFGTWNAAAGGPPAAASVAAAACMVSTAGVICVPSGAVSSTEGGAPAPRTAMLTARACGTAIPSPAAAALARAGLACTW
jgi:hypothetical protein